MAAQHVQRAEAPPEDLPGPGRQRFAVLLLQGVQDQPGEEEVVNHVALLPDRPVYALPIAGMDLRQQRQGQGIRQFPHPGEQVPGAGIVHEIPGTHFLGRIGKRVKPDNARPVVPQAPQGISVELPHQRGTDVQVHLAQVPPAGLQQFRQRFQPGVQSVQVRCFRQPPFGSRPVRGLSQPLRNPVAAVRHRQEILGIQRGIADLLVEGVPVGHVLPVRHPDHEDRQAGLAEEHVFDLFRIRPDISLFGHGAGALPEFVPVNKEIRVPGSSPVLQDVLKLGRKNRGVVQDKVQLQFNAELLKRFQVFLPGKQLIQPVVDDGKTPVQVRVEQAGKNIEGRKDTGHRRGAEQLHSV